MHFSMGEKIIMIPLVDLKTQYEQHKDEFQEAISAVLGTTAFILGKDVETFEKDFATFIGATYAVGVASGTDALHLALRASGIGPGDEVITVTNTFFATVAAIGLAGAQPVLVDCNPATYLIDVNGGEKAVSPKTKALIPVHLFGQVAPMDEINAIADRYKLAVIEDACQAHGARYKNRGAGTLGKVAAFSFFPGKNLGAFGDGGAVTTDDSAVYEKLLALRNYGSPKKYYHPTFGMNSRLDSIQAAILNVKLKYLAGWTEARQRAAARYRKNLESNPRITLPALAPHSTHVYHLFVIQVDGNRDEIMKKMADKDIFCGIHYPIPIHLQASCSALGYRQGAFPHAEAIAQRMISLPIYPEISDEQIDFVCDCLNRAL
jgi:dTDP-4-amino-4,6-dideoxygalactose transaminase